MKSNINYVKIQSSDLPSHGYNSTLGFISVTPMTYKELLEYDKARKANKNENKLLNLINDINLLRADTPNIGELNYFDFDALIMTKKTISIGSSPVINFNNVICSKCNNPISLSIDMNLLEYVPFDEDYIKKFKGIKLGNQEFDICFPKVKDVELVANKLTKYKQGDISLKLFELLCILNFDKYNNDILDAIENARADEIILLESIHEKFTGYYKKYTYDCPMCHEKGEVFASNAMTDLFQLLRINQKIDENKIIHS